MKVIVQHRQGNCSWVSISIQRAETLWIAGILPANNVAMLQHSFNHKSHFHLRFALPAPH